MIIMKMHKNVFKNKTLSIILTKKKLIIKVYLTKIVNQMEKEHILKIIPLFMMEIVKMVNLMDKDYIQDIRLMKIKLLEDIILIMVIIASN